MRATSLREVVHNVFAAKVCRLFGWLVPQTNHSRQTPIIKGFKAIGRLLAGAELQSALVFGGGSIRRHISVAATLGNDCTTSGLIL